MKSEGTRTDLEKPIVRLVKNGAADALAAIRPADADPRARVFGGINSQPIGRRFAAAARAAGIEGVSAHSGRVGWSPTTAPARRPDAAPAQNISREGLIKSRVP